MDVIFTFLGNLPWPSGAQIFTSICLGLITGTVTTFFLTPWRSYSGIWWHTKGDRVIRKVIIRTHIHNNHSKKLKYCTTGACAELSKLSNIATGRATVLSSSAGAVEATLHPTI